MPHPLTRPFRTAIQIGVVVRDIERSMAMLTEVFGIGPLRVVDCPAEGREDQQFCMGKPVHDRTRQAFADLGTVELELIEPVEGPTIWADFLATRGPGIHHVRFDVPDERAVSDYLAAKGIAKTQEGAGIREGSYRANYATEDNVVLSDHIGWYSEESQVELQTTAAQGAAVVLAGRTAAHVVHRSRSGRPGTIAPLLSTF